MDETMVASAEMDPTADQVDTSTQPDDTAEDSISLSEVLGLDSSDESGDSTEDAAPQKKPALAGKDTKTDKTKEKTVPDQAAIDKGIGLRIRAAEQKAEKKFLTEHGDKLNFAESIMAHFPCCQELSMLS